MSGNRTIRSGVCACGFIGILQFRSPIDPVTRRCCRNCYNNTKRGDCPRCGHGRVLNRRRLDFPNENVCRHCADDVHKRPCPRCGHIKPLSRNLPAMPGVKICGACRFADDMRHRAKERCPQCGTNRILRRLSTQLEARSGDPVGRNGRRRICRPCAERNRKDAVRPAAG